MSRLKLIRLTGDKKKTQKMGMLLLFYKHRKIFECYTLEPYDAIPAGWYTLTKYDSPSLKRKVLLFKHVPGFSFIEIHNGNFRDDTKGCILVGADVVDIDEDGSQDVTDSNSTLDKLLSLLPDVPVQIDVFENPLIFNT